MLKSENINELGAALAKAQGAVEGALKDSANPFFKNKYADLSSVWDACRQQLTVNGLSIVQTPTEAEGGIGVETMLIHSSGQWLSNTFTMPVSKADAQGVGSAITYARRYALAAMVGVAPEDDDGNAATKAAPKAEAKKASMLPGDLDSWISHIVAAENAATAKEIYKNAVKRCNEIGDAAAADEIKKALLEKWTPVSAAGK